MIFNMVGGGGGSSTKSTIIVSIETGSTVAAYSDSSYTTLVKTASEKSTGEYWLTGLNNGTYYIKATKGADEVTTSYTISEYGVYRITMNYWAAYINVTFSTDALSLICSDGVTTISATGSLSGGTYTFTVNNAGTWTVTASNGRNSISGSVIVSAQATYSLTLPSLIPTEYQEVEYLSSTSAKTQYIDTQIAAFDSYDIDFQYMEMYSGQNLHTVLGYRNDEANLRMMGVTTWDGKFDVRPPTVNTASSYTQTMDLNRHHIKSGELFNKQIIFDDEVVFTYTGNQTFPNVTGFLFAEHQGSRLVGQSYSRIYSVKIWTNGTLNGEFYPCYRVSDSVAGMYNRVNGVFYTNSGSGAFVVGGDV